jgi:acetyl esterase/lipase
LIAKRTIRYGSAASQEADLYVPDESHAPVVCLLHGGFWRMPYGREQLDAIARNLVSRRFAVWNLGYRRLGELGGGWPGTLHDVATGIDHLAALSVDTDIDLSRVIVVGHSAGGQLALWASARHTAPTTPQLPTRVRVRACAGLAAALDLARLFAIGAGNGAVGEFLGGSPLEQPRRYAAASPIALLPLGARQLIVHGAADDALPVQIARDYVRAAAAAGDSVQFDELPRAGHMDYLDSDSEAHRAFCLWLDQVVQ